MQENKLENKNDKFSVLQIGGVLAVLLFVYFVWSFNAVDSSFTKASGSPFGIVNANVYERKVGSSSQATLSVVARNNNSKTIGNAFVKVSVPRGMTFSRTGSYGRCQLGMSGSADDGLVVCGFGTLLPNRYAVARVIFLTSPEICQQSVSFNVKTYIASLGDQDSRDVPMTVKRCSTVILPPPGSILSDLELIGFSVPSSVNYTTRGTNLNYSVVIKNNGPGNATGVGFKALEPEGFTFKKVLGAWRCNPVNNVLPGNREINCVLGSFSGNLRVGQSSNALLNFELQGECRQSVAVKSPRVFSSSQDQNPSNNQKPDKTVNVNGCSTGGGSADLRIYDARVYSSRLSKSPLRDRIPYYHATVQGPNANDFTVRFDLPPEIEYLSTAEEFKTPLKCEVKKKSGRDYLECFRDTSAYRSGINNNVGFEFRVRPTAACGTITFGGPQLSSTTPDPNLSNNVGDSVTAEIVDCESNKGQVRAVPVDDDDGLLMNDNSERILASFDFQAGENAAEIKSLKGFVSSEKILGYDSSSVEYDSSLREEILSVRLYDGNSDTMLAEAVPSAFDGTFKFLPRTDGGTLFSLAKNETRRFDLRVNIANIDGTSYKAQSGTFAQAAITGGDGFIFIGIQNFGVWNGFPMSVGKNRKIIFKALPPMVTVNPPSSQSLVVGENELFKFTVSSLEDVEWGRIEAQVSAINSELMFDSVKLRYQGMDLPLATGSVANNGGELVVQLSSPDRIQAGTSKTYSLYVDVSSIGGFRDSASLVSGLKLDEVGTGHDSKTSFSNQASDGDSFVWSDRSRLPHSSSSADWYNGYYASVETRKFSKVR